MRIDITTRIAAVHGLAAGPRIDATRPIAAHPAPEPPKPPEPPAAARHTAPAAPRPRASSSGPYTRKEPTP
jgi:hypothetical protein